MRKKVLSFRQRTCLAAIVTIALAGGLSVVAQRPTADAQTAVNGAFNQFKTLNEGKNADYSRAGQGGSERVRDRAGSSPFRRASSASA